jgi:hypothetical protein
MYNLEFKLLLILEHLYLLISPKALGTNYNAAIYSQIY